VERGLERGSAAAGRAAHRTLWRYTATREAHESEMEGGDPAPTTMIDVRMRATERREGKIDCPSGTEIGRVAENILD
jgi:hypothetical protein